MSARLGAMVRKERERRGQRLYDFAIEYSKQPGRSIHPSMLGMLETGERKGDPRTWSGLWEYLGLNWNELYREWGMPAPTQLDPEVETAAFKLAKLPPPQRQVMLRIVEQADYFLEPVGVTSRTSSDEGERSKVSRAQEGVENTPRGEGDATEAETARSRQRAGTASGGSKGARAIERAADDLDTDTRRRRGSA